MAYHPCMSAHPLPLAEVLGLQAIDKRIDILRRIGQVGSISEAARGAGVSYKAAWQALETLANLAGTPLVDKAVGGSGGGGAALTPAGQRVLQAAQAMASARQQVLTQLASTSTTSADPARPGQAALALRTSMRNQFPCKVGKLISHQGQVRVQLQLPEGATLVSRITRESAQLLGLKPGLSVLALCKATAVQIARDIAAGPAVNRLPGQVTRASRARGGGEISLCIAGGIQLVGFAAAEHGLRTGHMAMAAVDEAGVVIAALS